ncbi:MAG: PKD domain-containing protein [Vicinamibacterales bacterium]
MKKARFPARPAHDRGGCDHGDVDGVIASYAWTFGDGASAAGPTPSHTYVSAGSYTARLTVVDNQGAAGTTSLAISPSVLERRFRWRSRM